MSDGAGFIALVIGGDLLWALMGVILIGFGSVVPASLLQGPFLDLSGLVGIWKAAGVVLGFLTAIAILNLASGDF